MPVPETYILVPRLLRYVPWFARKLQIPYIHTYIHDLTRISIDCLTLASRLRRSASVWINVNFQQLQESIISQTTKKLLPDYLHWIKKLNARLNLDCDNYHPPDGAATWDSKLSCYAMDLSAQLWSCVSAMYFYVLLFCKPSLRTYRVSQNYPNIWFYANIVTVV